MGENKECGGIIFNRHQWHYPRPGWMIRLCKRCGQPQTGNREGWCNSSIGAFEDMIKWADERESSKRHWKQCGLEWLERNGVL